MAGGAVVIVLPAAEVQLALQSFGDRADDVTMSALRTLVHIALREATAALKKHDYAAAQAAAFAALNTLGALDQRQRGDD